MKSQLPPIFCRESWLRSGVIHMSKGSLGLNPLTDNDQKGLGALVTQRGPGAEPPTIVVLYTAQVCPAQGAVKAAAVHPVIHEPH